jgi:hypothetical protein
MVLRKRRTGPKMVIDTQLVEANHPVSTEELVKHEQYQLFRAHFKSLSDDCKKLLNFFFTGHSLREICSFMGFSEMYAKKRKFICQKRLIAAIESDPLFKELKT